MADQWFILRDGKRHGPYSGADLKKYAASGHLLPIDLVVKDGMAKPVPAAKVKGLFPTAEPTPLHEPDDFAAATEQARPASRRVTGQSNRMKLYLVLGGCGLLAMIVVVAVVVMALGRKPTTTNGREEVKSGGDTARPGSGSRADSGPDLKVDLPDFSKVDYAFDIGKVDYSKGPQGQVLEKQVEDDGNKTWQQYQGPDGKILYHGPAVQLRGGRKIMEVYFFAGIKHGPHTEWYDGVQKQFAGVMKEGKKHGKWQHWHENGKPQKEEFFLNGVKHGPETNWYKDGTKEFESSFVDGNEHGRHIEWWENGKKANELHVKHGVRHGPATWWSEAGTVSMRLTFRDGQTSYDPASGTVEDFATANTCIFGKGNNRRLGLQAAFDTYGRPASGFAEVPNLKVGDTQRWVYRCKDGEATLRCVVSRNDVGLGGTKVDIYEVRKK
ncbi:MAG: GYF domain-containing protein [Bacteroidales bacterium]|nr:GYF domain-containing protein [Bacteroidales bacterium]